MVNVSKTIGNNQFKELSGKLDLLIKLTAAKIVKDKKSEEQILFLSTLGFRPKETAWLFGKTLNYVNVTLHKFREKK